MELAEKFVGRITGLTGQEYAARYSATSQDTRPTQVNVEDGHSESLVAKGGGVVVGA